MNSPLIPHASRLEKALSLTFAENLAIPIPIRPLWQVDDCPEHLLPYLAWSMSVDNWEESWTAEQKRNAIRQSISVHAHKGTVESIRRVLRNAGYGEARIVEKISNRLYDGTFHYDGMAYYAQGSYHWAMYKVYLEKPISIEQAEIVKKLLKTTAPARCHLAGLHFAQANNLYNNRITFNGAFTYGVA